MFGLGLSREALAILLIVVLILFFVAVYFVPSVIAFRKKRKNKAAILVLNILVGWTFIGWVAALVWALCEDK